MRIAVFHDLPSGGAKRAVHAFVRQLVPDHQVDLYAPETADEGCCDLRLLVSAVHLYPYSPPQHQGWRRADFIRLVDDWRSLFVELRQLHRGVAADIDGRHYDLVFVQQCQYTQSPYLLRDLVTPSVYYCQEPRRASFEYSLKPSRKGRLAYRARLRLFESMLTANDIQNARAATVVLASSAFSAESIKRAYGIAARICPLGVDLHTFRDLGLPRERTVLSIGGLHPFKRHDLIIRSLSLVPPRTRPRLRVVADRGPDEEADRLRRLAAQLAVDVTVERQLSESQLVEAYGRARATVCAADLEPFGLVPLESMACATPVVAVREGGYRETVVHGRNGLLVERDRSALAAAIEQALDPQAWEGFSHCAHADAQRWSWEAATKRLLELFGDTVGTARRRT